MTKGGTGEGSLLLPGHSPSAHGLQAVRAPPATGTWVMCLLPPGGGLCIHQGEPGRVELARDAFQARAQRHPVSKGRNHTEVG